MIGFRVFESIERVAPEWVAKFRDLPTANVSDVMSRQAAGGPALRPMHSGGVLAGPAVTVKTRPGDNLMVHKALAMAASGDVIVVDAGGDLTNAIIGELMVRTAQYKRLAGIIVNGSIRDSRAIAELRFPVYAAGVTHRGPYKDGPGEVNAAISLNGMVVNPGDLMLGDEDGCLCIPRSDAEAIYEAACAKQSSEVEKMGHIARGEFNTEWIDRVLADKKCETIGR